MIHHRAPSATLHTYIKNLRNLLEFPIGPAEIERRLASAIGPAIRSRVDQEGSTRGAAKGWSLRAAPLWLPVIPLWPRDRLGAALALWRGPAYGPLAGRRGIRWPAAGGRSPIELRLVARSRDRVRSRSGAGADDVDSCGRTRKAGRRAPLPRAGCGGKSTSALYRSGRQTDASGACDERVRRLLGDDLGIEPRTQLRDLEAAILGQDAELDWNGPRPTDLGRPPSPPADGGAAKEGDVGTGDACSPVGDGDVPVHRHRGFDASVGGRSRRDAGALAAHDDVLRVGGRGPGGWLFKHTGDGVCAAFGSARARSTRRSMRSGGWRCRCGWGSATGEAEQRGGDYFGPALNRAARVMAAGHGGQILVARRRRRWWHGVELVDLGEHRLRDLSGASSCSRSAPRGWRRRSRRCGPWTRCPATCRCR